MKGKDVNSYEERLGQILIDSGKVSSADLENSLALQKNNVQHKLLGRILLDHDLISKDDLVYALNRQLQSLEREKKLETNLSGEVSSEEGIKRIADKYKESEYFDDLYELISVITHKIRNPLAGISAAAEVLKERVGTNDANEKFFDMIFKEIDRLEGVVKKLYKTFSNK
ncbi:MAG: histidine kinase dimerization/phospho-acceptor domain-containing protein [Planctomycetota bacterium]|jgi:nitrogen-specific signal transduction histidine kinase